MSSPFSPKPEISLIEPPLLLPLAAVLLASARPAAALEPLPCKHPGLGVDPERRTTLREVIILALERFLESSGAESEEARKADSARLLAEMRAANTEPMQPLSREEVHAR